MNLIMCQAPAYVAGYMLSRRLFYSRLLPTAVELVSRLLVSTMLV